jgi:hypothetical protein
MVASLADLSAKLRELPEKGGSDSQPDWNAFDKSRAEAKSASDRGDLQGAVRNYSAAIRRMMKQLREHRPTVDADTKAI